MRRHGSAGRGRGITAGRQRQAENHRTELVNLDKIITSLQTLHPTGAGDALTGLIVSGKRRGPARGDHPLRTNALHAWRGAVKGSPPPARLDRGSVPVLATAKPSTARRSLRRATGKPAAAERVYKGLTKAELSDELARCGLLSRRATSRTSSSDRSAPTASNYSPASRRPHRPLPSGAAGQIKLGGEPPLGNQGATLILLDTQDATIDTVTYTAGQVRTGRTICFGRSPA